MDWGKSRAEAQRNYCKSGASLSIRRKLYWTRPVKRNNNKSYNNYRKRYRNYLSILTIISCIFSPKVLGNTSQTAAPVANTSASLTNMAIQTLQGNLIQNQYGNGVVCQGPMLTFSPFITDSHTFQKPREYWYETPVYDDDGNVVYNQLNRSGQNDNFSVNGINIAESIVIENTNKTITTINCFPNPASSFVNLEFSIENDSKLDISLVDNLGKLVYSNSTLFNSGVNRITLPLDNVSKGIYYIEVRGLDFVERLKLDVLY